MKTAFSLRAFSLTLVVFLSLLTGSAHATSFAVLLDGGGGVEASKNIREIAIDELRIDVEELTPPSDGSLADSAAQGYRLYGPGKAHWGNARITLEAGVESEFHAWYQEAAKGKNIRKNISVTLFRNDGTAVRTYVLHDAFPTQWSAVNFDTSSTVQTETLTVSIGHIELISLIDADDRNSGNVQVSSADGLAPENWDAWAGGEPGLALTSLFATTRFHTNSPGHKTVGELSLRGAMTDGRKDLCAWINETVKGSPTRRNLSLTEAARKPRARGPGARTYIYHDSFPVRYVFPRMSVTNTTGNTMEEVTVKPIRVELK